MNFLPFYSFEMSLTTWHCSKKTCRLGFCLMQVLNSSVVIDTLKAAVAENAEFVSLLECPVDRDVVHSVATIYLVVTVVVDAVVAIVNSAILGWVESYWIFAVVANRDFGALVLAEFGGEMKATHVRWKTTIESLG
mmetsp:Transcript_4375/g.6678  ORF Transcript_4375/g.6678 Transcript_4375/m.6678 type:complete len:136 (-) Transcript_4375:258-665(-)